MQAQISPTITGEQMSKSGLHIRHRSRPLQAQVAKAVFDEIYEIVRDELPPSPQQAALLQFLNAYITLMRTGA